MKKILRTHWLQIFTYIVVMGAYTYFAVTNIVNTWVLTLDIMSWDDHPLIFFMGATLSTLLLLLGGIFIHLFLKRKL